MNHLRKSIASVLTLSLLTLIIAAGYMAFTRNSIVGVVYAASNSPIAGATVTVVGTNASAVAKTDSTGTYSITSGLGSGTCSVTVTAPGYIASTVTVQVSAGSTTTVPGIVLQQSGTISGAIYSVGSSGAVPPPTWARGFVGEMPATPVKSVLSIVKPVEQATPLQGVLVVATQTSGGSSSSWALTDKNGQYAITNGLPSGTYKVTAGVYDLQLLGETPGYVTTTVSGVSVTAGQETPNQDYNLQPSAWISGNITASSGKPIFRALVTANSTTGGFSGYEYTDDTGFYRITTGLNASTYTVTAKYQGVSQAKTGVAATAGAETTNTNIQLAVPAGGEVIGRITDASSKLGIGQAVVQISGSSSVQVKTDPKGYYSYFLSAGSYVVSTVVPGFATNKTTTQVTNNQVARVYYPAAGSAGFMVNPLSGANSGKISGNVTGQTSPIPEFPVAIVPATFSIAILLILLANRRLKRNNNKA